MILLGVLILIVLVVVLFLWWDKFSGLELAFPVVISTLICCAILVPTNMGAKASLGDDRMILNGYVVKKEKRLTSCSHSYTCNCRTTTTGKVTSTTCQTCYEHSHDYDWLVRSTVGGVYIDRVDRQGVKEPKRFTDVVVGEPFSIEKSYFNYIKASPISVFKDYNAYKDVPIPSYPKIFDYYNVKHVVFWKSQYTEGIEDINSMLTEKLKVSSSKAKANVVVIFYGGSDDLIEATKVKQYGGRINDLTVMIRAEKDGQIKKVGVFSWSKNDMVNVLLRDEVLNLGTLNEENNKKLVDILNTTLVKYYQHRDNEEFKYLESNIQLPTWVYVVDVLVVLLILGANIFIRKEM